MKIQAFFKNCDISPNTIDVKDCNDKTQTILWDDDLIMNSDNFEVNDAYFANEVSDDFDYETEYLYQNVTSILDDFENGIDYKKIIFSDEAGEVVADFDFDEETGLKYTILSASWERTDNETKKDIDIKDTNNSDKSDKNENIEISNTDANTRTEANTKVNNDNNTYKMANEDKEQPDNHLNYSSDVIDLDECDNLNDIDAIDIYNKDIVENGKTYLSMAKTDALSESPSTAEKLQRIKEMHREKERLQVLDNNKEKDKIQAQIKVQADELDL